MEARPTIPILQAEAMVVEQLIRETREIGLLVVETPTIFSGPTMMQNREFHESLLKASGGALAS
jgi:hypothetical protein